jgi:RNA polymerase-interacting CarD/CdnL/TRCF family regulator
MTSKPWNHQYFESISAELPANIFRSLEIEQYFKKTLKDNGFSLQNYKINLSKSVINILLSVCKLKQPKLKINSSNESTEKILEYVNNQKSLKKLPIKKRYLQTAALCKNSRLKTETEKLKNI